MNPSSLNDLSCGSDRSGNKFLREKENEEDGIENQSIITTPEWFDHSRFEEGQELYREYFTSILFSNLCALLVGFVVPSLSGALIFTGDSLGPEKSRKRYLQTLHHLSLWHLCDILDARSDGGKSVLLVRKWHDRVRKSMTEKLNSGYVFVSQYDMALVQSGFIGPVIMYPEFLGIPKDSTCLEKYAYFWRVVGHCLGMEDQFNMCGSGLPIAISISKEIEQEIIVPGLRIKSETYEKLSSDFIEGFRVFFPWLSLNVVFAYIFPHMGLTRPKLCWTEYITVSAIRVHFWLCCKLRFYRRFVNRRAWNIFTISNPSMKAYQF